jgi:hypothetical protein
MCFLWKTICFFDFASGVYAFLPCPERQKIMAVCGAFQAVFRAFWSHLALLNHNQEHRK